MKITTSLHVITGLFFFLFFAVSLHGQTQRMHADPANTFTVKGPLKLNKDINDLKHTLLNDKRGTLVYLLIEQTGDLDIETFIAPNVAIAFLPAGTELSGTDVKAWARVEPEDKLSDLLPNRKAQDAAGQTVLVSVPKAVTRTELIAALTEHQSHLLPDQPWKSEGIWEVSIPTDKIHDLASSPFIKYIQPKLQPQTLNNEAVGITNAQIAHQPIRLGGYNLKGEGVTIGVGDNGDPTHIDFIDRVRSFNPIAPAVHANHVTGTVGGNGIIDERQKGFAPKSSIISDYFSQVLANAPTYRKDFDMVVTSNSYGLLLGDCGYAGTYDLYSQFLDKQALDLPDLLNVFAAANDGRITCGSYPLGYGTVTGSYSTAKNVLTVANIGKTQELLTQSSSQGPVKDGRLKPEITAIGTNLISTSNNNEYEAITGTSMATPNVSGASVLLYEYFRKLNKGRNPDNALIKNILMNGADDIGTPGPDFRFGFGLMNVGHSLRIIENKRYYWNQINTGQSQTFQFSIPPNTAKAKIMLNWNDPASAPPAAKTLINDLDLSVTGPDNTVHLPFILDATPELVTNAATPGLDRTNNVEQVTLDHPAPGNYTITVKGHNIPVPDQKYFVSYDFDPEGITIQYPFGGEALAAGDAVYIYWEASNSKENFSLSYSDDNGANWKILNTNIAYRKRAYVWEVPATIASSQCLVRIQRGNRSTTSKQFTVISRPVLNIVPAENQCPGSIKFTWNPIPEADSYQVFLKSGAEMLTVASTTDTFHTLSGLSPDSLYWVAVSPSIDGESGMRSLAVHYRPNTGKCSEVTQHGNLSVASIVTPQSGRKHTTSSLSAAEEIRVRIRNLDNQIANNFKVSYQINEGNWQERTFTTAIGPSETKNLSLGNANFSDTGMYDIKIAVTNLSMEDPVKSNDTLLVSIRHVDNRPLNFSSDFHDGFEQFPLMEETGGNIIGVGMSEHWDFSASKPEGRIRSFINSEITISESRSISLDNAVNWEGDEEKSSLNTLTGTFNIQDYQIENNEIRCSFDYLLHAFPKFDTGNGVWIRGSDTDPWLRFSTFQMDTNNPGRTYTSGSLSLNDALTAAGQSFSSSTQIKFEQKDTSKIGSTYFGNGLTLDNFSLYLVENDIALLSIDSIAGYNCNLSTAVPLTVTMRNGVNNQVNNITVNYQLGDQAIVSEHIDSIGAKDTLVYTFQAPLDLSEKGFHNLSVWVSALNDTYHANDSILNYSVRNQPVIDQFPYIEDFEENDGYFYTTGEPSSWAYGTPASPQINHAASGSKAWKTNLTGNYKDQETSFLYSPCYDISQLESPMLSFHIAIDLEAPGEESIYDHAYVEYSKDGINWEKLEAGPESYNWYNTDSAQVWTKPNNTYWHVATTPLPSLDGTISLRFVLRTDQAANFEGIAIDDIHIYDLHHPIFEGDSLLVNNQRNLPAGAHTDFSEDGDIAVTVLNGNSTLNDLSAQSYRHDHFINQDSTQYFLPRSFTLHAGNTPADSVTIRFFIPDEAIKRVREDDDCPSCSQVIEVQQLGITTYQDSDAGKENNLLSDNNEAGMYDFIPKEKLRWIPYDKGYYCEVRVKSFSEFWFNDGGPEADQPVSAPLFDFKASHFGPRHAFLSWQSWTDQSTNSYDIQKASDDEMAFNTIATINAVRDNEHVYSFVDTPALQSANVFYRIKHYNENGKVYSSVIRQLSWSENMGLMQIYPNPVNNGSLFLEWFKGNDNPIDWSLYDISGKRISRGRMESNNYNGKESIDLGNVLFATGIYILKVNSGKEKWEFKVAFRK